MSTAAKDEGGSGILDECDGLIPGMKNNELDSSANDDRFPRNLLARISRLEVIVAAVVAVAALALVIIEPNVLEAPFENANTLLFTFGGTIIAAVVFAALLWFRVPAFARIVLLGVPFALVNWWLISPYFVDDVVDEAFEISLTDQAQPTAEEPEEADGGADAAAEPAEDPVGAAAEPEPVEAEEPSEPAGPVVLGAGQFVGLAGHEGTGDAGLIQNPDGSYVLRFENFDIENGPALVVYLVPGADQVSLPEGSINLGDLKGNIGDQNYELPAGTELPPGPYTALVWCEAFSVEFVGATVTI